MRIDFWAKVRIGFVSAVTLLPANAQQKLQLSTGVTITAITGLKTTWLRISKEHTPNRRIALKRDGTTARKAFANLHLVAETSNEMVIFTDTYASLPGGLSFCQAGEEQFLRIVDLSANRPVETYHAKLASCRDSIELAEHGLQWNASTKTLVVHWFFSPDYSQKPETATITVNDRGKTSVNLSRE